MGRLFDNPAVILIILVVIVLLFAAPKLPGMARSLGQSMRIIKSEVSEMKNDGKTGTTTQSSAPAAAPVPQPIVNQAPVEGTIVNNPPQQGNGDASATGSTSQS